ncbi:hypothetical protein JOC70_002239 [Clostridium pascui]|nr:hypothetical protein [Clostridium pascui]
MKLEQIFYFIIIILVLNNKKMKKIKENGQAIGDNRV